MVSCALLIGIIAKAPFTWPDSNHAWILACQYWIAAHRRRPLPGSWSLARSPGSPSFGCQACCQSSHVDQATTNHFSPSFSGFDRNSESALLTLATIGADFSFPPPGVLSEELSSLLPLGFAITVSSNQLIVPSLPSGCYASLSFGQSYILLVLVFSLAVCVGGLAGCITFKEQYLSQTFTSVNLCRQRAGI